MNYEIPKAEVDNLLDSYWQLLKRVENLVNPDSELDKLLIDGGYNILNRAGISNERPYWESKIDKSKIDAVMETIYPEHRYRWCRGGACGCMGCVNHKLQENGFNQSDHKEWVKRHPRQNSRIEMHKWNKL